MREGLGSVERWLGSESERVRSMTWSCARKRGQCFCTVHVGAARGEKKGGSDGEARCGWSQTRNARERMQSEPPMG